MAQSEELTEFYTSYLAWLEEGAPAEPFSRQEGLCWCLNYFAVHCDYDAEKLLDEMCDQFREADLSVRYPFHRDGSEFSNERTLAACHLNPKRIQWVKEHSNES